MWKFIKDNFPFEIMDFSQNNQIDYQYIPELSKLKTDRIIIVSRNEDNNEFFKDLEFTHGSMNISHLISFQRRYLLMPGSQTDDQKIRVMKRFIDNDNSCFICKKGDIDSTVCKNCGCHMCQPCIRKMFIESMGTISCPDCKHKIRADIIFQ